MIVVKEVFEEGIQFANHDKGGDIIDLLTPQECRELIKEITNALFIHKELERNTLFRRGKERNK